MEKIKIGKIKDTKIDVFLEKHEWVRWYWSFGHLSSKDSQINCRSIIPNKSGESKLVINSNCNNEIIELDKHLDGWIILELLEQAKYLSNVAEMYFKGYTFITRLDKRGINSYRDKLYNRDKADSINNELENVLNDLWKYVNK